MNCPICSHGDIIQISMLPTTIYRTLFDRYKCPYCRKEIMIQHD